MKILLAVPSRTGWVAWDHARSVQRLYMASMERARETGQAIEWMESSHRGGLVHRARNAQAAAALAYDCDALLFIDDDIGFEPADVFRMIDHGLGVVGAIPQKRAHKWSDPPRLAVAPHGLRLDPNTGLALPPEPKLPMALTLISTQVLRDIRAMGLAEPWVFGGMPDEVQPHMAMYFNFELNSCPDYSVEWETAQRLGISDPKNDDGEDHYFCRRAAAAGYDIVIDTEVELRHWEGQICHDYSFKKMLAAGDAELRPAAVEEAA